MIRFYRPFVIQLLAVLNHLRNAIQKNPAIQEHAELDLLIRAVDQTAGEGPQSLIEMVKLLNDVLYQKNIDTDLIDLMVDTVKLPYSANRWSNSTITKLRKVLLLPDELSALVADLKKQELSCTECGTEFLDGHLIVLSRRDGGNGVNLYCSMCKSPEVLSGREGILVVSKLFVEALKENTQSGEVLWFHEKQGGQLGADYRFVGEDPYQYQPQARPPQAAPPAQPHEPLIIPRARRRGVVNEPR